MTVPRDALGLGLRPDHYAALRKGAPVGFLEVLVENHVGRSELPRRRLDELAGRYPMVGHGVSLDVLGTDPLDHAHLRAVRALVARYAMPWMTDHLCFSRSEGLAHHDLLPCPNVAELVPYAAARIRAIQAAIGVPFGVENVSAYLAWARDDLPEWAFLRRVAEQADCGLLLDVNNIWVSAHNLGFDPYDYLDAVPWPRVLQVHVAGHRARPDGLLHDTHDQPVCDEVWALYAEAWRRGGPFPTVLEWDAEIPALDVALATLARAAEVRA